MKVCFLRSRLNGNSRPQAKSSFEFTMTCLLSSRANGESGSWVQEGGHEPLIIVKRGVKSRRCKGEAIVGWCFRFSIGSMGKHFLHS